MTKVRLFAGRAFDSLRVRNYRLFFWGQLVSLTGTWMQLTAQAWLVLKLTGSGTALGVTAALQFLPMLLFGVWGGVLADRLDKRRTLLATQSAAAVIAFVMWLVVASGVVELWMIYTLAFLLGVVTMVDNPTRQAFVSEMVGPDGVANAVGLNSAVFNAARLVGPAAAGLLIRYVGIAPSFLVNAVSFLAVIAGLVAMRSEELHRHALLERRPGQIREGLRYAWETPVLRSSLLLVTVIAAFGFNFQVVLPLMTQFVFHGDSALYGLLSSVMALGSVAGALTLASRARPTRRLLLGGAAAFGATTLAASVAPNPLFAGVVLVAVGATLITFIATANSTLQLNSDPTMRGRVMALYGLVFLGSTPIGGPLVGWIAETWGARAGLAFGGAVSLFAALASRAWEVGREIAGSTPHAEMGQPRAAGHL